MTHDLKEYHSRLNSSKMYVAKASFLQDFEWQSRGGGHVFAEPFTRVPAVGSIVGRVLDFRFACGPSGNFRVSEYAKMEKAKYQLFLGKPFQTEFADDFDKVVPNLETAQKNRASTADRRYLIYADRDEKNIRFAENVFVKRPSKINTSHNDDKGENKGDECGESTVDYETEHWPVSAEFRKYVDEIKYEYKASPLRVYGKGGFVERKNVEDQLKGALIELRFDLHHYFIEKEKFDSFNAGVQQIIILQPGNACAATAYKRKDVRDGPISIESSDVDSTPVRKERRVSVAEESIGGRESIDNTCIVGRISGGDTSTSEKGKEKEKST
ncbi:hypothetical protein EDB85DRAFT_1950047 [Lactarius pseudohatsudake]|nr:hypothetical protein EDB85DRAFT_1950047 [Lactarius pseudohatsudake]